MSYSKIKGYLPGIVLFILSVLCWVVPLFTAFMVSAIFLLLSIMYIFIVYKVQRAYDKIKESPDQSTNDNIYHEVKETDLKNVSVYIFKKVKVFFNN